jgi:hypothetical protein
MGEYTNTLPKHGPSSPTQRDPLHVYGATCEALNQGRDAATTMLGLDAHAHRA